MTQPAGVLVVTGGSRGIGEAVVRGAAGRGYAVCFTYGRDGEAAAALAADLHRQGHAVTAIRADAADATATALVFDAAEQAFGPVTALVNNAGLTGPIGPFAATTADTMRRVFEVNAIAPMVYTQEALRRWRQHGIRGAAVNLSSIAATLGAPHEYVHYAASKAAVEAFTIGLGKELAAEGIRINAVAPGTVETGIHAAAGDPGRPARVAGRIPMQRIGTPDEIARAVLWLLSAEASYVTGTVLRVSGGL